MALAARPVGVLQCPTGAVSGMLAFFGFGFGFGVAFGFGTLGAEVLFGFTSHSWRADIRA
jgi:hypothetical protein